MKRVDSVPRVGSAAIVVDEHGRVLLGLRSKEPNRGRWVLPGGKVEPFESIEKALCREVEEETGLIVEVTDQVGAFEIINPPKEHRLIIFSWARPVGGKLQPGSDLTDVRFVDAHEFESMDATDIVSRVLWRAGWLKSRSPVAEAVRR